MMKVKKKKDGERGDEEKKKNRTKDKVSEENEVKQKKIIILKMGQRKVENEKIIKIFCLVQNFHHK